MGNFLNEMIEDEQYKELVRVLFMAYTQAAHGKGRERHAEDKPFHKQDIVVEAVDIGRAYNIGQARKKLKEGLTRLEGGAEIEEYLGAINYIAGAVLAVEAEMSENAYKNEKDCVKMLRDIGCIGERVENNI